MKTIFFNQRSLILCSDKEPAAQDPEAVIAIDNGSEATLKDIINTFDNSPAVPRLYILCRNPEETYDRARKAFTEVEAAGGLIRNGNGQYLLIFRNGVWDLPKGKREHGETLEENAVREVMEECGIPAPSINGLICVTDHTYHRDGQFVLKHTYWYAMSSDNGTATRPQTEEGITRTAWIPASQIAEYAGSTYPSIAEVFRQAGLI